MHPVTYALWARCDGHDGARPGTQPRLKRNVRNAEIVTHTQVTDREQGDHMTSYGRVARLTALALATGTLVAAGAGSAGAANTTKTTYTATGGGSVLRLTVNLPVALPNIGNTLTQDLVLTGSNARTGDAAAAITSSILGANGNVPLVSGLLDKSVQAEYGKPQPAAINTWPDTGVLGITGKLLSLESKAGNPNVDGTVAHSLSTVSDLRIEGAGNLDAVLSALTAQLQTVLNQALGSLGSTGSTAGATGTLTTTVGTVLDTLVSQVNAITQNAIAGQTQQVADAIKAATQAVLDQVNLLPSKLQAQLKAATTDTSLLHIGLIQSEQTVTRAAGTVTSDSAQKLVGVSVLGGLVTVDGLTSAATASLGDGLTKATQDVGRNAVLKVNVGPDLLTAEVTNGLTAALGGSALPTEVVTAVNGALDQITSLLNTVLGATLNPTKVGTNVATADKASSSVNAAELVVNPALPGVGALFPKPLVDIQFVPSAAEVVKAQSTIHPAVITPAKAGSAPHALAQTGAELPLTGAVAAALMGLAAVARRRRAGGLAE